MELEILSTLARILQVAAAIIIAAGAVVSVATLVIHRSLRPARLSFAHALLYAFDFTIAADILKLAVVPDLRGAALIGAVVGVRVVMTALLLWEVRHE